MSRRPSRMPVKLHKNVTLIRTVRADARRGAAGAEDAGPADPGRLSDTVLLVRPDEADAAIEELRRMGHTPRIVR